MTLFKKEWHQWFAHASIELLEKNCVFGCFWLHSPLFVPKKELLPCSSLHRSLKKKSDGGSASLPSLFTKERPWTNCSHCFLQKSNHEWFTPLLFTKELLEGFNIFQVRIAISLTKDERFAQKPKNREWNTCCLSIFSQWFPLHHRCLELGNHFHAMNLRVIDFVCVF